MKYILEECQCQNGHNPTYQKNALLMLAASNKIKIHKTVMKWSNKIFKKDTNGTISCLLYLRRHIVKGVLSKDAKHISHILVPQK